MKPKMGRNVRDLTMWFSESWRARRAKIDRGEDPGPSLLGVDIQDYVEHKREEAARDILKG
jgi:hypothetical protein